MAEYIYAGSTSQSIDIFLQDSSSATGAGLTGLVYNSSGLTAYYRKGATGSPVAISLQARTLGQAWASGGFVQVDATVMPGVYRLDLPDLMIDTAGYVTLYLRGATNLLPTALRIQCGTIPSDIRQLNGSTQNADRMPISDSARRTIAITGSNHVAADIHESQPGSIHETTFDADAMSARVLAADAVTEIQGGLATASALAAVQADTDDIQARLPAALVSGRMDSHIGAMGANTLTAAASAADFVTEVQSGLSTLTAAQVNAELLDVLATDLFAELAAVPAASSSLKDKISFLFMLARNKVTQTASTQTLFADNTTTPVATSATSDVGGTFTRGEFS